MKIWRPYITQKIRIVCAGQTDVTD